MKYEYVWVGQADLVGRFVIEADTPEEADALAEEELKYLDASDADIETLHSPQIESRY